MQHLVDHNDLAYALERGFNPLGWLPCPRGEAGKINPQSTQFYLGDNQWLSVVHIKPVYYETTYGTWRPLSEITEFHGNRQVMLNDKWRLASPRYIDWLTKRQALLGSELLLPTPFGNIHSQELARPSVSIGLATTTVYPDPHAETTTVDGRVGYGGSTSWGTVHDAASGNDSNDNAASNTAPYAGRPLPSAQFYIYRYFSLFDASSIDDGDTVSAATYSLYVTSTNNGENDGDDYISVITTTPSSNTSLANGDYDQVGTTEQHDSGERKDLGSISTGAYTDWAFNSTGMGNISLTGVSKFGAREGHDLIDSAYNGSNATFNGIGIYHADQSGTSNDPKLAITHAAATSSFTPKVIMF